MVEDHRGRKCIIVGASYGIGRSIADILASRGAHVVYISRNKDKLLNAIEGKEHCHAVVMDASKADNVERGMEEAISILGGDSVDLVVYCPGYFGQNSYGSFERLFESGDWDVAWKESMSIHFEGMMQSFRYTRKALLKSDRGGVFIGLSSIAGAMGHPGAAMYAICKAAVDHSLKQLALEYAPLGLRVYSVAPGLIDTPAIVSLNDGKRFLDEVSSSHAMKRAGKPEEVGELVAFLASERASFITCSKPIYVDGGALLRHALSDSILPFFDEREKAKRDKTDATSK